MGPFFIFILRLVIAALLAFIICRMFFQGTPLIKVFGLAGILLGFAYLFEYLKSRDKGGENGS
jgi:positive regulator of sigma E activity